METTKRKMLLIVGMAMLLVGCGSGLPPVRTTTAPPAAPPPTTITPVPPAAVPSPMPPGLALPRIAFVRRGNIVIRALDGSATPITTDGANSEVQWSRDGTALFFIKTAGTGRQTWRWRAETDAVAVPTGIWSPDGTTVAYQERVAADDPTTDTVWRERGGQRQPVSPTEPGVRWQPLAWSPDGQRLALARIRTTLVQMPRADGTGIVVPHAMETTLWMTVGDPAGGQRVPLDTPADVRDPITTHGITADASEVPDVGVWSPDGKYLTIGVAPGDQCNSCRADGLTYYVLPVDGSAAHKLDGSLWDGAAPWAANDARVVLSGPFGRETYRRKHLEAFDPATGAHIDLASSPAWADIQPAVSPDGTRIAFTRGQAMQERLAPTPLPTQPIPTQLIASRHIWVMGADGAAPQPIADAPGWTDEAPVWAPDSGIVLFVRWHNPTATDPATAALWAVRPDGSHAARVIGLEPATITHGGFGSYGTFDWRGLVAVAPR